MNGESTTPQAIIATLVDLLTRAIPALSVSIDLAKSDASRAKRRKLLREVEAAVGNDKVVELMSSSGHDAHMLSQCSNPDCEEGQIVEDYCPTCEQPIGRPCPSCVGDR